MFIEVSRIIVGNESGKPYTTDQITVNTQVVLYIEQTSRMRVRREHDEQATMLRTSKLHMMGGGSILVVGTPNSITARTRG